MYLMVQDLNHLDNEDLIFTNLLDLAARSMENVPTAEVFERATIPVIQSFTL